MLKGVKPDLVDVVHRAAEISSRPFAIVQGFRTAEQQAALWAKGRTKPGPMVTWSKKSKHLKGEAIDFAALVNGKISWNDKLYPGIADAFKKAAMELKTGIEWGGDWVHTKDWGHVQLSPQVSTPRAPTAGIGWTISDIQKALVKHGFDPGKLDGIMGPKTHKAIAAFQTAHGLAMTGGPDKDTTDALARPAAPQPPMALLDKGPATADATGSVRWTVQELQRLGMTRLDAITYTANLIWESGGHDHINWTARGDGGHSHGAGQWNDRADRFNNLTDLAAARGTSWDDPATQLQHLVNELKSTEVGAQRKVEAATTLKDKMKGALTYWRPGVPHEDKRLAIAQKLDKEIEDV
jgi:peptidoglycan L-alanyl-D-glutamate endopeptidase CwlK